MSLPVPVDVSKISDSIFNGLDALFTSDEEKKAAKLKVMEVMQQPHILQAMANIEEAKHTSIFVAGWRPALGWLAAICLGYAWIIKDFLIIILTIAGSYSQSFHEAQQVITLLPTTNTEDLMTLVMLLLGLGGIRAYEAKHGVKRNKL